MPRSELFNRRGFCAQTLGSLITYSLLETVICSDALADAVKPIARKWLAELNQMSRDLKGQKLKQTDWQKQVEQLYSQIELEEFLSYVDFPMLTTDMIFRSRGERSFKARFPDFEGRERFVFGHQMFAVGRGRSVVPHGHDNMATAFLVLQGEFEGKHYDRLEDLDRHMIIKPTIDRKFKPGDYSTVSDHKDNVHWFKAMGDSYIFNIHVMDVDPKVKRSGRVYIDPNGEKLSGGRIKADRITSTEAFKRYG